MKSAIQMVCDQWKNGNIAGARANATRFPASKIASALMERGLSRDAATDVAEMLKKPSPLKHRE